MDAFTIGTIVKAIIQSGGGAGLTIAFLAVAGLLWVWKDLRAERRARSEFYAKKDADTASQIAQERSAHMSFMRDLVQRTEEREKGFLAFMTASTKELERIGQRLEQSSRDGDERHKEVMAEFRTWRARA